MKPNGLTTVCLALLMLLQVSCGKETKSDSEKLSGADGYSEKDGLTLSAFDQFTKAVRDNDLDLVKKLLFESRGRINVNREIDGDEDTLLCLAVRSNFRKIVEILLDEGANIEQISHFKDTYEMTPINVAASRGFLHLVKTLIEKEASPNKKDFSGRTALHHAIERKFDDIAIYHIQNGADLNIIDYKGRNAYSLALSVGSTAVIDYLGGLTEVGKGAAPDAVAFRNLIVNGDVTTLNRVLAREPELAKKYEVINPLALAVELKDENVAFAMVKTLILYQVDSNGPEKAFSTPLIKAVKTNRPFIAEYLIQRKANVNIRDSVDNSPLKYAIEMNLPEMVDLLLAHGADKSYRAKNRRSRRDDFKACIVAWLTENKLHTDHELENNKTIRLKLGCR
jgi:ankyrin repeat protein